MSHRMRIVIAMTMLGCFGCDVEETAPGQDMGWGTPDFVCATAMAHVTKCTGLEVDLMEAGCDPDDAESLLETPCEVLETAARMTMDQKADNPNGPEISFACQWFGVGCPVDDSCFPTLSPESVQTLIVLSDPTTLVDEYDTRYRIQAISNIFEAEPDPIGMFSIVYRHITNNAVYSVEEGYYEHEQWTRDLITAFARRYLVNLHGHLTGGHVTHPWRKYYKLARDCSVGRGRVLGVAIATHLIVDLAYAVHDVKGIDKHEEDYMLFGEISLWVFPNLVEDIQEVYKTDVSGLLTGFFLGEWMGSGWGGGGAAGGM